LLLSSPPLSDHFHDKPDPFSLLTVTLQEQPPPPPPPPAVVVVGVPGGLLLTVGVNMGDTSMVLESFSPQLGQMSLYIFLG